MTTNPPSNLVQMRQGKLSVPSPADIMGELSSPVRLKTWSLIVSLFGDAILPRGGSISAISLGKVMEVMGVESGAVRTAISRLAADGWIERERNGRASFYRMATFRQNAFEEAAERIYSTGAMEQRDGNWAICALPLDVELEEHFTKYSISLQKNWFLINLSKLDRTELPASAMLFEGAFSNRPAWFLELLAPQEQAAAMDRLIDVFTPLETALNEGWEPDPLNALAYRCLLIHDWRRIALRLNRLPLDMLPADWPEAECRSLVRNVHRQLFDKSEHWLTREAHGNDGALPIREQNARQIFK